MFQQASCLALLLAIDACNAFQGSTLHLGPSTGRRVSFYSGRLALSQKLTGAAHRGGMLSSLSCSQATEGKGSNKLMLGLVSGLLLVNTVFQPLAPSFAQDVNPVSSTSKAQGSCSSQHWSATLLASTEDTGGGFADLPPCLPWSSGPCVSVNGPCFADEKTGCGKSFKECAENKDCQKGLSCLARCKGEPTCSTGCFAAFADDSMTNFLGCALEDKECINFPKDPKLLGWLDDGAAAPKKVANFDINSLKGDWIKVLGLDDRYDCFECQQNRFREENGQWRMDTTFRLPRARGMSKVSVEKPLAPNTFKWEASTQTPDSNYLQNDLTEEVFVDSKDARPSMHTTGKTFGLTFWENYYIVGQGKDWQFVRYVGHTLQGGYKGAFVLSRTPELSASALEEVKAVATEQGLDLSGFCRIKNKACGTRTDAMAVNDLDDYLGDANKHVEFMFGRQEKFKP